MALHPVLKFFLAWTVLRSAFEAVPRPTTEPDVVFWFLGYEYDILRSATRDQRCKGFYRLYFSAWIEQDGVVLGRRLVARNRCVRLSFEACEWNMEKGEVRIESPDKSARIELEDKNLIERLRKANASLGVKS